MLSKLFILFTIVSINLGYGTNQSVACGATSQAYKIDSEYFCDSFSIYNTDGTIASDGFYSFNGVTQRVQALGLLSECVGCSSNTSVYLGTPSSGGGNKIICNELYTQGFLSEELWDADERYGEILFENDPKAIIGYQMWARNVVKYMRNNPQNTKYLYRVLKPWTEYMGYEMGIINKQNYIGKTIHTLGKYYSYLVFNLEGGKRLLNLYNYKKFRKNIG